jgi:alpha-galactosidase
MINFSDDDNYLRGIHLHLKEAGAAPGWKARDLWAGKDLGPIQDDYTFVLKR